MRGPLGVLIRKETPGGSTGPATRPFVKLKPGGGRKTVRETLLVRIEHRTIITLPLSDGRLTRSKNQLSHLYR